MTWNIQSLIETVLVRRSHTPNLALLETTVSMILARTSWQTYPIPLELVHWPRSPTGFFGRLSSILFEDQLTYLESTCSYLGQ